MWVVVGSFAGPCGAAAHDAVELLLLDAGRSLLRAVKGAEFEGHEKPWHVGRRRLLAKTCWRCGRVLSARFFYFDRGKAAVNCILCWPLDRPKQNRVYDQKVAARQRTNRERLQAFTIPYATRHKEPYTEADGNVLADPDLTLMEKALRLERTYKAVHSACVREGFASRTGPGDPMGGEWTIDNPNLQESA